VRRLILPGEEEKGRKRESKEEKKRNKSCFCLHRDSFRRAAMTQSVEGRVQTKEK